jgi:septal ring factor EnvC (AmiA/AmiB activator)
LQADQTADLTEARFSELLVSQAGCFEDYLCLLDGQYDAVQMGSSDSISAYIHMEEKTHEQILALQKAIDAMQMQMLQQTQTHLSSNTEISREKSELESLKMQALIRINRNKDALASRMKEVREEIKTLQARPIPPRSVYAGAHAPSLIDITL